MEQIDEFRYFIILVILTIQWIINLKIWQKIRKIIKNIQFDLLFNIYIIL